MTEKSVDIAIVGGGLVGNVLALSFADYPLSIALIEAKSEAIQRDDSLDVRSIGLSYGSHRILSSFGLWNDIKDFVTPIKTVHVSDKGHFGFTRIHAKEQGLDALGYNVQINNLLQTLMEKVRQKNNIRIISPATVTHLQQSKPWQLGLNNGNTLTAKLLIATDGTDSFIRQALNIDVEKWDYKQTAITANLSLSRSHHNIAYERFTKNGPLALLPLRERQTALIWTVPTALKERYLALSEREFLAKLKEEFGYRLGKFEGIGHRLTFPLQRIHIKKQYLPGVVFMGNAAHTLHPIAAQGFNLALRNVAALSQSVKYGLNQGKSCEDEDILKAYVKAQKQDQQRIATFTHHLLRLFSNDNVPLSLCRNLGLLGMDIVPGAKNLLTKFGLGGNNKRLWFREGVNNE